MRLLNPARSGVQTDLQRVKGAWDEDGGKECFGGDPGYLQDL